VSGRRPAFDSQRVPGGDTEPWYRQFWPWFLIALPGSVVIAALSTLYIANRHADDLVVDDYYKNGLAINERFEKTRSAEARGLRAELRVFERRLQLRMTGGTPEQTLRLQLAHPLEADRDFTLQLSSTAPGLYTAELPRSVAPNWHWTLDAGEQSSWRLDGSLGPADFLSSTTP
jgi:hypothetical protein